MDKTITKGLLFFLLMTITGINCFAQINKEEKPFTSSWQIGAFGGFAQYYGDISNKSYLKKFSGETNLSFGLMVRRHFDENFGFGVSFNRANLYSVKDFKADGVTAVNLEYDGLINHFTIHSYLNFSNFFWGYSERTLNLYGTLGLGYVSWTGSSLRNSQTGAVVIDYSTAATNNFKNSSVTFPATLGAEFKLSSNLKLTFECTLLTLLSDDMDYYRDGYQYDIVTQTHKIPDFEENIKSGYPYDIVTLTHVGLSYFIGGQKKQKKERMLPSENRQYEPVFPINVIDYEVYNDPPETKKKNQIPALTIATPPKEMIVTKAIPAFEFRVQIYAKTQRIQGQLAVYRNVTFEYPIQENFYNGIYRYSTGSFQSYAEAEAYAHTLQNRGVYDAFVVAYRNNERIQITTEMKKN
ncbi:MAG: hypothetical protein CVT92_13085 [Bacteroidetes bacterium HGW-Bacteroidetes-1]|jgi:opacity protein-like surface antigen|nr:MAG: hypothetical protein CVT92_13085 [Bacteroidetes bacterium HGW-Bacteroidetes-1]